MKLLSDEIVSLRAVEPSDGDAMWEIETDSRQWIENGMMAPYSRHNLREYAENYDADPIRSGQLRLVIDGKIEHEILGLIDLYEISALLRTGFIGIYIKEDFRRKGYGTRALTLMERYAALLLNLRIVGAKVASRNNPSRRLFEKNGYSLRGELPGWLLSGTTEDSLIIYTKRLLN